MSLFASTNTSLGQLAKKDPAWFQTSNKRVIPNHLVPRKKLGFQLSTVAKKDEDKSAAAAGSFNSTDFNVITFGNQVHRNSNASFIEQLILLGDENTTANFDNDDLPLYNNSEDLPPSRSLYDLNDEVFISLNRPAQHTESFINKDPKSFNNVFARNEKPAAAEDEKKILSNPLQHSESAILVFGYPENMANQVIGHFLEFGTVLEKFEAARTPLTPFFEPPTGAFPAEETSVKSKLPPPPIFSGKSWVKLTYDNPASAIDALQESGVVFNGVLIGVVPYTKDAVEKLQKRKLTVGEDIGGGLQVLAHTETSKVDKGVIGDVNDMQATYIKRLEMKDGSELFLKAHSGSDPSKPGLVKKNDQKLGFLGTISNYLFGFHDL